MNRKGSGNRKTKKAAGLVPILCLLILPVLSAPDDDLEKTAVKIMGEAFVRNNAICTLRFLSDEIGSRLTGSEACHRAAQYCLDLFHRYGLTNVHTESYETAGWLPGQAAAEASRPFHKQLRVDTLGYSMNTPSLGLTAPIVDVGHGTEEDFARCGPEIKGKIVLAGLNDPADPAKATKEWLKVAFAAEKGAAACLIISGTKGGLTRTRASNKKDYSAIPAASIAYEDGTWIRRLLGAGKPVEVRLLLQNTILGGITADNVIAEIRGVEKPHELVILGAHLDSWFLGPGAADNALGVSIAMETARILSDAGIPLKRTVRFVLFSGEEQGLFGSFAYVKKHEDELDDVVLMVNLDMTGLMYPGSLNPYGVSPIEGGLADLLPVLGGLGVDRIERRYPYDSDDFNFIARGVPAMGLQGRGVRDWSWGHSYADTSEKIEIDKLNMNTAAIAVIMTYAANRPKRLAGRASREEVIAFFKKINRDKELKKEGTWEKLGLPFE